MKETSFLFRDLTEAKQFYFFLLDQFHSNDLIFKDQMITLKRPESLSTLELVELIYPFILDQYGTKISHYILEHHYYFEEDERDQIIPYIVALSATPKLQHAQFQFSLYERLTDYFFDEDNSFIPMDKLYQKLFVQDANWIEIVGFGIEEWKQEIRFQDKMNELRYQLEIYEPIYETVTVLLSDSKPPSVLDEAGSHIDESELPDARERFAPDIYDLLKHSVVLRKLLLIAPKKVIVYASNKEIHNLYGMMNVFQERVEVRSVDRFPFISL